jgi:hypothetical protein
LYLSLSFFWVTSSTLRIGEFWLISKEITILLNPTFSMFLISIVAISKMPILLLKISPHNLRSTYLLYANRIYCTFKIRIDANEPLNFFLLNLVRSLGR